MTLGTYILQRMQGMYPTQKALADRLGISEQYLSDIINGRREPTTTKLLIDLAAALYVNSDVMFFYAGVLPPDIAGESADELSICEAFLAMRRGLQKERDQ